jgi:indole-3-glycerol phosphate synthase
VEQLLRAPVDGLAIVTEPNHFGGSLDLAHRVRRLVDENTAGGQNRIPLLRKDVFKRIEQMDESRKLGFDAVQLTLRTIGDIDLVAQLRERAEDLGMSAAVSVHDFDELNAALKLDPSILAINNRDIARLEMDTQTVARTEHLMPLVPKNIFVISESGLSSREDVVRAGAAGADAVLIGTALAKCDDPAGLVRLLRG